MDLFAGSPRVCIGFEAGVKSVLAGPLCSWECATDR
jgi:hypothetical protein